MGVHVISRNEDDIADYLEDQEIGTIITFPRTWAGDNVYRKTADGWQHAHKPVFIEMDCTHTDAELGIWLSQEEAEGWWLS